MLPSNYVRLDYIESHGTEYIDTLLSGKRYFDIDFKIISSVSNSSHFFGFRRDRSGGARFALMNYDNLFHLMVGGDGIWNKSVDANKHSMLFRGTTVLIDGTTYKNGSYSGVISYDTFKLFGVDYYYGGFSFASMRIYNCKMYGDGDMNLLRDFVPAKNKDTGVVGLYDLVNDVFYTNQGTGTFTYGHEIPENIILEDNPLQTTLENDLSLQANFKRKASKKYLIGT